MVVERFLGASFASVHGPSDPEKALRWTLDCGFCGLVPAPSPRPVDWRRLRDGVGSLPFRFGAVRVSPLRGNDRPLEAGLGSPRDGHQQAAMVAIRQAVGLAGSLRCGNVIVDPGLVPISGDDVITSLVDRRGDWSRDRAVGLFTRRAARRDVALEALCRSLHQLCREFPDVEFCLTLSRNVLGLGEPRALEAVFEDLGRYRIRYWHDTVAAACRSDLLGEDPEKVLNDRSNDISGMTLGDYCDGETDLPPGTGGVDYPLLSAYRRPSTSQFPVVIELDPAVDPGEIRGIHAFLSKFGL